MTGTSTCHNKNWLPLDEQGAWVPSMGCPDNDLLVFRWHFRAEGMALYPPKPLSERVEGAVSCPRRSAFFRSFRCLLTGCRKHANMVKVPWEQGLGAVPTTLRLYAKCFTPIRKTPCAYTQNEKHLPKLVLDWCTKVARFFAILHRRLYWYSVSYKAE